MDDRERLRQQRLLAEEFGLFFEETGHTRMDGRVTAWLLLADPPVQSLTQIAEALGVSKAAVSTTVRSLVQMKMIERVSEPGRRGDFYRSQPGDLERVLQPDHFERLGQLVDRGLELVADKDQSQSNYALLSETRSFLTFLQAEIPGLMARWQAHQSAQRPQADPADPRNDTAPDDRGGPH